MWTINIPFRVTDVSAKVTCREMEILSDGWSRPETDFYTSYFA